MSPKKKGKKTEGASKPKSNPADAILQHKTKQILTDNQCDDLEDLNSEEDDGSSDPMNNNNNNNQDGSSNEVDGACLHCQSQSASVQVRCDECNSYICNHCHWCHEFQANHEIRVCDRCDAFYCRVCDEMDQCDDCGEVVCGTCSTLLSCKFCGGGLCEECATACGRCGIVLCSRDAKFAVDCDTCRLSYCLVCLASGNRDPCVRCGHRPSKRMEQLVHLRLKSIYKAFKSSTATAASASASNNNISNPSATASSHHSNTYTGGSNNHGNSGTRKSRGSASSGNTRLRENDDPSSVDDLTPGALMLAAAASAAAPSSQLAAAAAAAAASVAPNSQLAAAAQAAAGCGPIPSEPRYTARVTAEMYELERVKAEKAAADLLAELDEEEQVEKSKKSKKKKKKERQQAKKAEEDKKKAPSPQPTEMIAPEVKEKPRAPPSPEKKAPLTNQQAGRDKKNDVHLQHAENTTTTTTATSTTAGTSAASHEKIARMDANETTTAPVAAEPDPLERKFEELEANEDSEGLEELLASIKGVPGKAMLRKNVKKALKRMRVAIEEAEDTAALQALEAEAASKSEEQVLVAPSTPSARPAPLVSLHQQPLLSPTSANQIYAQHPGLVTPPIVASPRVAELLTIVSQNHNKVSSNSRLPKGHPGTPKSECIMHMAPLIVGWVIGKGGQRIRDLMEESGARIWIDQDSMGPTEARIVYVSGQRSNVDTAVRMITDLIAKAPTETPNSKLTSTPGYVPDSQHSNNTAPSLNFNKVPGLPVSMNAGEGSAFQLKPREKKKSLESKAWREMTCDPRFVPLLIGRRGWTIKNIQDSSGARVDIDQNVTPRKITISGSDAAVDIAARMVNDVLSYPHSLLHGAADGVDIFPPSNGQLLDNPEVDVDAIAASSSLLPPHGKPSVPLEPSSPVDIQKNHSHHSPPSSLIMAGDGKSTISATSSLSSTPEPSVNNKTNMAMGQVPPLLPPAFDQQQTAQPGDMMQQNSYGNFLASSLQQSRSVLQGGLATAPHDTVGLGLGMAQAPQQAPSHHTQGFLQGNHQSIPSGPLATQTGGQHLPLRHGTSAFEHQMQPQASYQMGGRPDPRQHQAPLSMHQPNGFATSLPPLSTPDSHGRPLVNPPMPPSQPQQSAVLPGMWDSGPIPQATHAPRDGFGLQAAVDFLHHSQEVKAVPMPDTNARSGVNELMGLSNQPPTQSQGRDLGGMGLGHRSNPPTLLQNVGKDDANIVESLFGSTTDRGGDSTLVSGLRGLSLDPVAGERSDLWGASGAGFDLPPIASSGGMEQQQQHQFNATSITNKPVTGSSLFSTTTDDRQHSRFSWGESG